MGESSKWWSESKSWGWSLEEKKKKKIRSSSEDVSRRVVESADSAIRSARSLQNYSSQLIQSLQGLIESLSLVRRISSLTHDSVLYLLNVLQHFSPLYKTYEDAFFNKIKDEVACAREHPALIGGVVTAGLLLMRGPRRFLFRHTFGRLQSEEAQFVRADKNVEQLGLSVNLMKKESEKLLERASLAEVEMKRGHADLMAAGSQSKRLAKSIYKVEAEAVDLMDLLCEIPNREALKLRAEVASMVSALRQRRTTVKKG